MKQFIINKRLWLGLILLVFVVGVFMLGFLASIVNPQPKDLPIAIVIEDEGMELQGTEINLGQSIKEELLEQRQEDSPVEWTVIGDYSDALDDLASGQYYGMLYIPQDTSEKMLSLLQPEADKPSIGVMINEGSQYMAATAAEQALNEVINQVSVNVQMTLVDQLNDQGIELSAAQITPLLSPLAIDWNVLNEVGDNTANGNLPILLTQILWLSVFIASVMLFLLLKKVYGGQKHLCSISAQVIGGLLSVGVIVTSMLLLAKKVFSVDIQEFGLTFLFMLFVGIVFFFLQNALINWIGLISAPIILLLFLFSIPVLNFPPEFLPQSTNTFLYSWIPLRFSVEGLRGIFFFDEPSLTSVVFVLASIGLVGLLFMYLSIFNKKKQESPNADQSKLMV